MQKKSCFLVLLIPLLLSLSLSCWKFQVAQDHGFELDFSDRNASYGVMGNGFVVLYPDELTYLSWLDQRAGSFSKFISGEGGLSLNIYGYFVSAIYYILGESWQYVFLIGIAGFYLFFLSSRALLNALSVDPKYSKALLVIICCSPTVINLTSGFLRDLFVIAFMNYSVVALIKGRYLRFVFFLVLMSSLRTYMPIVIFPMYVFFYLNGRAGGVVMLLSFVVSLSVIGGALYMQGAFYNTSYEDVIFRLISGVFGLNVVVLNAMDYFSVKGVATVEKFSHVYQFIVMIFMYLLIIRNRFKAHVFFFPFILVAILLSILYGSYLGYFVARTKLLIFWLAIIFIGLQWSKYGRGKSLLPAVTNTQK